MLKDYGWWCSQKKRGTKVIGALKAYFTKFTKLFCHRNESFLQAHLPPNIPKPVIITSVEEDALMVSFNHFNVFSIETILPFFSLHIYLAYGTVSIKMEHI